MSRLCRKVVDAAHALDVIVAFDVIQTKRNLELAHLPPMEFPEKSYYGVQASRRRESESKRVSERNRLSLPKTKGGGECACKIDRKKYRRRDKNGMVVKRGGVDFYGFTVDPLRNGAFEERVLLGYEEGS